MTGMETDERTSRSCSNKRRSDIPPRSALVAASWMTGPTGFANGAMMDREWDSHLNHVNAGTLQCLNGAEGGIGRGMSGTKVY